MRQFIFIALIAAVVAGGTSQFVWAQPKAPSPADIAKAAEAARQRAMQQFDLNRDGILSDQERAAAEQAAMQAVPAIPGTPVGNNSYLRQFDRDGDGKLSAPEIRLAREMSDRMRRGGGAPQRGFTPGGAGGAAAPPPAGGSKGEAKAEKVSPLVKRFDKDGDGKLNEEEKAAAQADLKGKKKDKAEKPKGEKKGQDEPAEKAGK